MTFSHKYLITEIQNAQLVKKVFFLYFYHYRNKNNNIWTDACMHVSGNVLVICFEKRGRSQRNTKKELKNKQIVEIEFLKDL